MDQRISSNPATSEPMSEQLPTKHPVSGDLTIDDDWIRQQYPRIHRAAWLMTGDPADAEDLAQETFIVALERWNSFQGRSSRQTWLYGILIRLCQRRRRSLARFRQRLKQYIEQKSCSEADRSARGNPEDLVWRQQWQESIWASVARLPAEQQTAVTLRFAEEMSYQQIAEVVGCAVGTAKTRVHHGLRRLREFAEFATPEQTMDAPRQTLADEHFQYPVQCNE